MDKFSTRTIAVKEEPMGTKKEAMSKRHSIANNNNKREFSKANKL